MSFRRSKDKEEIANSSTQMRARSQGQSAPAVQTIFRRKIRLFAKFLLPWSSSSTGTAVARAYESGAATRTNSLVGVVFDACIRPRWSERATSSNCKSRDYRRLHSEHIVLPFGIGSPSKHLFRRYRLRTRAHRHRLGRTKYRTTLSSKRQSRPMSVSQGLLPRRCLVCWASSSKEHRKGEINSDPLTSDGRICGSPSRYCEIKTIAAWDLLALTLNGSPGVHRREPRGVRLRERPGAVRQSHIDS
jgi:hypothetical protein